MSLTPTISILGIFTLTYATRVFRDVLRFENKSPASRSVYAELVGHDMMELGAADPSGSRSDRRHSPSAIDNPGTAYRSHTAGPQSGEADEYTGFEFGWGSSRPGDGAAGGSARSAPPELSRDPRSPGLPSPGLSSPGLSSPGLLSPGSPGPSPRGMTKGNGVGRGRRWRHADKSVLARVVPGHGNEQEEADATHDLLLHEKSERASVSTFSQFKD